MKIVKADITDIPELYQLQSFESETEMIGSLEVPALMETKEENIVVRRYWIQLQDRMDRTDDKERENAITPDKDISDSKNYYTYDIKYC